MSSHHNIEPRKSPFGNYRIGYGGDGLTYKIFGDASSGYRVEPARNVPHTAKAMLDGHGAYFSAGSLGAVSKRLYALRKESRNSRRRYRKNPDLFKTFIVPSNRRRGFLITPDMIVDTGISREEAMRQADEYNNSISAAQKRKGTRMAFSAMDSANNPRRRYRKNSRQTKRVTRACRMNRRKNRKRSR